jgi:hypothetical protein
MFDIQINRLYKAIDGQLRTVEEDKVQPKDVVSQPLSPEAIHSGTKLTIMEHHVYARHTLSSLEG